MTEDELKNLLKVIKSVKKLGVKRLKMDTLEFEIETNDNEDKETRAARPALKVSKKKIAEQNENNELQQTMNFAQEELSTLHVEDPAAFEQAIIERAIVDNDEASDNDINGGDQLEETYYQ